jgi:hypothetical protein
MSSRAKILFHPRSACKGTGTVPIKSPPSSRSTLECNQARLIGFAAKGPLNKLTMSSLGGRI